MEIPIEGAKLKKIKVNKDERGNFIEVLRQDQDIIDNLKQVSISTTLPGVIKAFHMHEHQTDVWHLIKGKAIVGLYDTRKSSKTFKTKHKLILEESEDEQFVLKIPIGVAHGYKAIGDKPLTMLYIMDNCYNYETPDEIRMPHDDKEIDFNWDE
jgi:dTDP-4-dehydrorhamnose 3,5-epimerase